MRTLLSWSTGKDSAWSLHVLRQRPDVTVVGLVTTVNAAFDRVAMHGVRREPARGAGAGRGAAAARAADPLSLPQRGVRAHHGRVRRRAGRRRAWRRWRSATCSWRTSAAIARASSPAPALRRCSRCGASTRASWRATMIAGGLEAYVTCVDPRKLPAELRRPALRCGAARRAAGGRRSLRRERRVPHLRLRRADVSPSRSRLRPARS